VLFSGRQKAGRKQSKKAGRSILYRGKEGDGLASNLIYKLNLNNLKFYFFLCGEMAG
jgi:hypothetical protein